MPTDGPVGQPMRHRQHMLTASIRGQVEVTGEDRADIPGTAADQRECAVARRTGGRFSTTAGHARTAARRSLSAVRCSWARPREYRQHQDRRETHCIPGGTACRGETQAEDRVHEPQLVAYRRDRDRRDGGGPAAQASTAALSPPRWPARPTGPRQAALGDHNAMNQPYARPAHGPPLTARSPPHPPDAKRVDVS